MDINSCNNIATYFSYLKGTSADALYANNKLANYVCSNLEILYLRCDGVTQTVSLEIPYWVKFMDLFYLSVVFY